MERFRLVWKDVVYRPGELKVIAYDASGNAVMEKTVRTAGKPYALKLTPDRSTLAADGEDLSYINVSVVDRDGNPVPCDSRSVKITVEGSGKFRAMANGDPTSLELFHIPQMKLFSGQLTAIIQSGNAPGRITVHATARGLKKCSVTLRTGQTQ